MQEKGRLSAVAPAIELKGISKAFGAVKANKNISLRIKSGSIHGIIGENGAGKSTLMSILYGYYKADIGEIFIKGKSTIIQDSQAAIKAGIGMVFQHFKLVQNFTVLENIILGVEDGVMLRPSLQKARQTLSELAREYGLSVDPNASIQDLSVGYQQRVEILKALYRQANILILDEPTGVLTPSEASQLFRILQRLRSEGKTIVLITHKLREIMDVTETVSVMRQGEMVGYKKTESTNKEDLAEMMVGRSVLLRINKSATKPGNAVFSVRDLVVKDDLDVTRVKNVNLDIHEGEILGLAGVTGNGQTELLEALSGIRKIESGEIQLFNETISNKSNFFDPKSLKEKGLAHVPEDRQRMGLVTDFKAYENLIFGYHHQEPFSKSSVLKEKEILSFSKKVMEEYDVRPRSPNLITSNFSGGNQQKIILSRELNENPKVLLVGQPTRGVDIGAIEFIHQRLIDMRDKGAAILLVSVELEEVLSLSDRIVVMFDGNIVGEKINKDVTDRELGLLMAGVA